MKYSDAYNSENIEYKALMIRYKYVDVRGCCENNFLRGNVFELCGRQLLLQEYKDSVQVLCVCKFTYTNNYCI